MIVPNSTDVDALQTDHWDVIVIGAGVAGSLAALLLARNHHGPILIVDSKRFPREKVCGCCLNQRGQAVLERHQLLRQVEGLQGVALEHLNLLVGEESYCWPTPRMLATRRSSLDCLLVNEAVMKGAVFCDSTRATLLPATESAEPNCRSVQLKSSAGEVRTIQAAVVVVADGLTQSSLSKLEEFNSQVQNASRIGIHGLFDASLNPAWAEHRLVMAVTQQGYVGVAPVDGGCIDIAAAIDPATLTKQVRPGQVVCEILQQCGQSPPKELLEYDWMTTPQLTRRSTRSGGRRMILLGDSLGYVEPFTGEGMSWALQTAELSLPILLSGLAHWSDEVLAEWDSVLRTRVVKKQWMCHQLTQMIRSPIRARWAARLCHYAPPIRRWAMKRVSGQ